MTDQLSPGNQKLGLMFILFTSMLLIQFAGIMCFPALPQIARYFHTSSSNLRLVSPLYILGLIISQIILAYLQSHIRPRSIFYCGFLIIIAISILESLVNSKELFLTLIVLMGVGTGFLVTIARAVANTESTKKLNLNIIVDIGFSIGLTIGPLLGGYIAHYAGWRPIYYVLAAIAALTLVIVFFINKHITYENNISKFTSLRQTLGRIFSRCKGRFGFFILLNSSIITIYSCYFITIPFLLDGIYKFTPDKIGIWAMLINFAWSLGNISAYFYSKKITDTRLILYFTVFLLIFSLALLITNAHNINIFYLLMPSLLLFYCVGVLIPIYWLSALKDIPDKKIFVVTMIFLQNIYTAICTTILAYLSDKTALFLAIFLCILASISIYAALKIRAFDSAITNN